MGSLWHLDRFYRLDVHSRRGIGLEVQAKVSTIVAKHLILAQVFEVMLEKKALLVIDMQKGSFTPETPRFNTQGVVERINGLAKQFRNSNQYVFFVQHNGIKEDSFLPNTVEWELLSSLNVKKDDIFIEKYANDCFYKSNLAKKLSEMGVNELFVAGCATDFCVDVTVKSALAKDYNITIIKNAHTTANRPHLSAKKVIAHYNWVWQNMIATAGTIRVCDMEEIKHELIISNR